MISQTEKITLILEDVEEIGLLIEYENNNDFSNINDDEILKIKKEMYEKIKSYGIKLEEFKDIKKAYELIKEKYNL